MCTSSSYLHACDPPIIHGNLACDTIFIQHNGLVKIGSVAPEAIDHHVKTCREKKKNMHYIAPEYAGKLHAVYVVGGERRERERERERVRVRERERQRERETE